MGNIDIERKENTIEPRESRFFPREERRGLIIETNATAVRTAGTMDSLLPSIFLTGLSEARLACSKHEIFRWNRPQGARSEFQYVEK